MSLRYEGPICYISPHDVERDIVVVVGERRQPFYRSSGHNSGLPGEWLPFDGLNAYAGCIPSLWFDKDAYMQGMCRMRGHPLYRLGNEALADLSRQLKALNIGRGQPVHCPLYVNQFLNTPYSLSLNPILVRLGLDK